MGMHLGERAGGSQTHSSALESFRLTHTLLEISCPVFTQEFAVPHHASP